MSVKEHILLNAEKDSQEVIDSFVDFGVKISRIAFELVVKAEVMVLYDNSLSVLVVRLFHSPFDIHICVSIPMFIPPVALSPLLCNKI